MGLISLGGAIRTQQLFGLSWLEFVGLTTTLLVTIYNVPKYIHFVYKLWIAPALGQGVDFQKMGKWAVVTGATDGIGKAFAEELARRGVNVVLISRTKSKLDAVARDIRTNFGVQTKEIAADFTAGIEIYKKIQEEIQGLEIGTLINNVGMASDFPKYFLELDLEGGDTFVEDILFCNVFSLTLMSKLVMPQMVSRQRGVVINVGSILGLTPVPMIALYSATKAYVDRFSQSLAAEYKSKGIIVQSLIPGTVSTKMIHIETPSFVSPSASDFVRCTMRTVGVEDRTSAYWFHRMVAHALTLEEYLVPHLMKRSIMTFSASIRSELYKILKAGDKSSPKWSMVANGNRKLIENFLKKDS